MQTEAAMSLSDAWLGEGDAAAGDAQEEVQWQALQSTAKDRKILGMPWNVSFCGELSREEDAPAWTLFRLAR